MHKLKAVITLLLVDVTCGYEQSIPRYGDDQSRELTSTLSTHITVIDKNPSRYGRSYESPRYAEDPQQTEISVTAKPINVARSAIHSYKSNDEELESVVPEIYRRLNAIKNSRNSNDNAQNNNHGNVQRTGHELWKILEQNLGEKRIVSSGYMVKRKPVVSSSTTTSTTTRRPPPLVRTTTRKTIYTAVANTSSSPMLRPTTTRRPFPIVAMKAPRPLPSTAKPVIDSNKDSNIDEDDNQEQEVLSMDVLPGMLELMKHIDDEKIREKLEKLIYINLIEMYMKNMSSTDDDNPKLEDIDVTKEQRHHSTQSTTASSTAVVDDVEYYDDVSTHSSREPHQRATGGFSADPPMIDIEHVSNNVVCITSKSSPTGKSLSVDYPDVVGGDEHMVQMSKRVQVEWEEFIGKVKQVAAQSWKHLSGDVNAAL